ncbi:MAG: carbonic anhydrase [Hyphomicrobiales bacterium]|nr:carbonic anhydrase [Hyphomicrobiales bacterium]MDE2017417.1 carbonic anhydrase [Hyphomicrobiales bacterium]
MTADAEKPGEGAQAPLPAHLLDGYRAFVAGRLRDEQARYRDLAEKGQNPRVMLIGCCDSRAAPETVFGAGPGELFVVRNVANIVPTYGPDANQHGTSAALEFAVMALRVEHVVVMGHARCGGVRAFAESLADPYARPLSAGDFIGSWIASIKPAADRIGAPAGDLADYVERLGRENVRQSLANLRTFPWVAELERRGILKLHGAYFGIADGRLETLEDASGAFVPVRVAY